MRLRIVVLLLLLSQIGYGQSEKFVRKTYDTLMTVRSSIDNSVISSVKWLVRITMDSTYLQDIARDSNLRRPVFIETGGKGEIATGNYASDTSLINRWAWEYWHNTTGYDYSVRLGNGIHHPVMVSVLCPGTMRPWYWLDLFRQLYTLLKPRDRAFHVAGLSEGSHDFGCMIPFTNGVAGNQESMSYLKSWVDLEGVGPETFLSTDYTVTQGIQIWVNKYRGRFFGLEGIGDGRNISAALAVPMNSAIPGSAYFAYEKIGCVQYGSTVPPGGHGCWNPMYDPTVTNWQCVAPITNTGLVADATDVMGSYSVDPNTGTNIFQWMLRQGDTTLVGPQSSPTYPTAPGDYVIASGEYVTGEIFGGKLYTTTTNPNLAGANGGGLAGATNLTAAPSNVQFSSLTEILHGIVAIDITGTPWSFGGNTMGTCALGNLTANIGAPTAVTRDSAGHPMTNISLVKGTYAANQAEGLYLVVHGVFSDTLDMAGNTGFGLRGDGYTGDTAAYPVQVWPLPAGKRIVQIASEKYSAARLSDGSIWTCGGGGFGSVNYSYLGYIPTKPSTDYLTWHQVVLPSVGGVPDSAVDIVGGDIGGTIVKGKSGNLYGWGPNSEYLGNVAGGAYSTPTLLTNIMNAIPGGARLLNATSFGFHIIGNNGKLYGWGDNAMGVVGNGDQINLVSLAFKFFVDPAGKDQYMVTLPVQITNRSDFVGMSGSVLFGMHFYAWTAGGIIIATGRNKGGVIATGELSPNSNVTANMPDSWDRPSPTEVDIKNLKTVRTVYPPMCVLDTSYVYCSGVTRPSTIPTAYAGANQVITGTTTVLDGSGSNCVGGDIIRYHWRQVTGPTQGIIDITDRKKPEISGLNVPGAYQFELQVTDNAQRTSVSQVFVTVSGQSIPKEQNYFILHRFRHLF